MYAFPESTATKSPPQKQTTDVYSLMSRAQKAPLVDNPQIQSASLHSPLPFFLHLYIWPFLIAWPLFSSIYLPQDRYDKYIGGQEWTFVWAGTIVTIQSLTWLTTKWNVNLDSLFTSVKARSVREAKLIKVIPILNAGSAEICRLERDYVGFAATATAGMH